MYYNNIYINGGTSMDKTNIDITLLDNFANYYDNSIEKIEIIIKSPSINVKFSNLELKPKNNIIICKH